MPAVLLWQPAYSIIAHELLKASPVRMQLDQLPEDIRAAFRDRSLDEGQAQAVNEYSKRFVVQRPDASCLNAASSGQSATVNAALTGGNPFQVLQRCWQSSCPTLAAYALCCAC